MHSGPVATNTRMVLTQERRGLNAYSCIPLPRMSLFGPTRAKGFQLNNAASQKPVILDTLDASQLDPEYQYVRVKEQ